MSVAASKKIFTLALQHVNTSRKMWSDERS